MAGSVRVVLGIGSRVMIDIQALGRRSTDGWNGAITSDERIRCNDTGMNEMGMDEIRWFMFGT